MLIVISFTFPTPNGILISTIWYCMHIRLPESPTIIYFYLGRIKGIELVSVYLIAKR